MQVATGLASLGFESHVACPGDSDIVESALAAGLTVHPLPTGRRLDPLTDFETVRVLTDRIRHGSFDVVHAHGAGAGLTSGLAATLGGCSGRVVTVYPEGGADEGTPAAPARRAGLARRWLTTRVSRVITTSDAIRDGLLRDGIPARLVVTIPLGVDLVPYMELLDPAPVRDRYGVPRDALLFGTCARFTPRKGMDVLVDAAVPVLERVQHAWLLLAGDGSLLDEVRRQASRTRVAGRIVFPGYETDIPGLLRALDVFVSAAGAEGPIPFAIEAMASGLPVLAPRSKGNVEVVTDAGTGMLVDAAGPEELSSAMLKLARDAALRVSMGEAGRRRAVEVFAEERMLQRIADVYREVSCSSSRR